MHFWLAFLDPGDPNHLRTWIKCELQTTCKGVGLLVSGLNFDGNSKRNELLQARIPRFVRLLFGLLKASDPKTPSHPQSSQRLAFASGSTNFLMDSSWPIRAARSRKTLARVRLAGR